MINVLNMIRLIGLVCWLWHQADHRVVSSSTDEATGDVTDRCFCVRCRKVWEVTR